MRDDFDKWIDQWEQAQKEGIFDDNPTKKEDTFNPEDYATDFFGNTEYPDNTTIKDIDGEYWDKVYRLSNHQGDSPDPLTEEPEEMLTEETEEEKPVKKKKKKKKVINEQLGDGGIYSDVEYSKVQDKSLRYTHSPDDLAVKANELGNTANPIYPNTRGKDQRPIVTPDWSGGSKFNELAEMRLKLYELQSKLNADPTFGAYSGDSSGVTKVQNQINELWKNLDKLSSSLSPDFIEDELSG